MQAPGSGPAAGFGPTPAAGFRPTPLAGARPRHSIKVQKSGVDLLGWFGPEQTNLQQSRLENVRHQTLTEPDEENRGKLFFGLFLQCFTKLF